MGLGCVLLDLCHEAVLVLRCRFPVAVDADIAACVGLGHVSFLFTAVGGEGSVHGTEGAAILRLDDGTEKGQDR